MVVVVVVSITKSSDTPTNHHRERLWIVEKTAHDTSNRSVEGEATKGKQTQTRLLPFAIYYFLSAAAAPPLLGRTFWQLCRPLSAPEANASPAVRASTATDGRVSSCNVAILLLLFYLIASSLFMTF